MAKGKGKAQVAPVRAVAAAVECWRCARLGKRVGMEPDRGMLRCPVCGHMENAAGG